MSSPIPGNAFSISSLPAGPDLPNPTRGSELAESGRCSVLSRTLALAVLGALAVAAGVRSTRAAGAPAVAVGIGSATAGALAVAVDPMSATPAL
ncbi:MAG: hypothetical protein WCA20_38500 [Candidatus Sulfotelmatobacter sp.]